MATAGSKEAKQLEQIKNTFDKAYKEMSKASEADSNLNIQFEDNTRKNSLGNKEIILNDKNYVLKDSKSVSYDALAKIGEIDEVFIDDKYSQNFDYNLEECIDTAIKSSGKVIDGIGYVNMKSFPYTIKITKSGLRHGLIGKHLSGKQRRKLGISHLRKETQYNNANICEQFAKIIENAVVVNELASRDGGLVLMGYAKSKENRYAVRIIARKEGNSYSIDDWDSTLGLKAVNAKKIEMRQMGNHLTEKELNSTSNISKISIDEFLKFVNSISDEFADTLSDDVLEKLGNKKSEKPSIDVRFSLSEPVNKIPLKQRVSGDELLNAQDTLELIKDVGGAADNNGFVTLYHRTSKEKAKQIIDTKRMSAKEDGIFFSTSESGYNDGYGDTVLEFKVPVEILVLDDIFGDEAHFRIPLKNRNETLDVSEYIISENDEKYSLSNSNQDIAPTKDYRIYGKDIKLKDNIAPVNINKSETISKKETVNNIAPVNPNIAKEEPAPAEAESKKSQSTDKPARPLLRTEMKSISRSIKRSYGSTFDPTKDIMRLYNAMHSGKLTDEEAAERATEIGRNIAENIKSKPMRTSEAQEVLDMLRNSRIKLDVEQISEVSKMYDGYNNYKQSI